MNGTKLEDYTQIFSAKAIDDVIGLWLEYFCNKLPQSRIAYFVLRRKASTRDNSCFPTTLYVCVKKKGW